MIQLINSQPLLASFLFSFGINFAFFLVALIFKTDKVTDLSYSLTFAVLAPVLLFAAGPDFTYVQLLVAAAVLLWALRLGGYLFLRIVITKTDERFDDKRSNPANLIRFWVLQMIAVWVIMLPITIFLAVREVPFNLYLHFIGFALFAIGFVLESVSDHQKFRFKSHEENKELWIEKGLWKYSRHPNYFGEMLVWWGLFVVVTPALGGLKFLTVAGPVFITLLLLFVSGIPLLEKSAEKKYGENPLYRSYRDKTSLLVPLPPKSVREDNT
ncbi:MAG: DUF1295 domain-containing protein [Spirochaetales bacterium]|nr:DUF1295 domain-containing protein [Spirochaetales bacterium]